MPRGVYPHPKGPNRKPRSDKGRKQSKERIEITKRALGRPEVKAKMRKPRNKEFAKSRKGEGNPFHGKHHSRKSSEAIAQGVKKWINNNHDFICERNRRSSNRQSTKSSVAKGLHNPKGTTLEQEFDAWLQSFTSVFRYVGNTYEVRVGEGRTARKPDWVYEERYLALDLFSEHWHSPDFTNMTREEHEQERIQFFRRYNWNLLVIWENDFKNNPEEVKRRILEFIN